MKRDGVVGLGVFRGTTTDDSLAPHFFYLVFVCAAEASNEVVFKGLDSSFGCILLVEVRRLKLEVD
jgi:hypothetical protein